MDDENSIDLLNNSDDDNISDNNGLGMEEVRDSESEETNSAGESVSDSPDYSSILADIDNDLKGIYDFITVESDPAEITLSDIHNDLRIVGGLILLFIGFYVMRSIVYKFTRRF